MENLPTICIFNRQSYLTANNYIYNPSLKCYENETGYISNEHWHFDFDESENHVALAIEKYKGHISAWARGDLEEPYLKALRRGLEIEEELLKNIKGVNNNAKSARFKK